MPNATADVVIVGGGIVGLCVAHSLAAQGVTRVVVVERDQIGAGASRLATGGVRHQFATAVNVRLSLLARPFWLSAGHELGPAAAFQPIGYLFAHRDAAGLARAEAALALQHGVGVPSRLVSATEMAALAPGLRVDDLAGGTYCAWDGVVDGTAVLEALAAACLRRGTRVLEQTAVTGLALSGGRVTGVRTSGGAISAGVVVNAAGNQAAAIHRLAGLDLPLVAQRRQAALVTAPGGAFSGPWTVDLGAGCYARPDAATGGAVIGGADRPEAADLPIDRVDQLGLDRLLGLVAERFPRLAGCTVRRAWAGRRPLTPDDHAVLGRTPVQQLLVAAGLGSHGLMHAPAVGLLLSQLICDGEAQAADIAPLSAERFVRGELLGSGPAF